MSRIAMLAVFLIATSSIPAEAKRFRALPGTSKATPAAPVARATPAIPAKAPGPTDASRFNQPGSPGFVLHLGNGASVSRSARPSEWELEQQRQRSAVRDAKWAVGPARDAPGPAVMATATRAQPTPNPDARQLPVLGLGSVDGRPAKGFQSLN